MITIIILSVRNADTYSTKGGEKYMKKLLKFAIITALGVMVALSIAYVFTMSKMEFNFANTGKVICVTKKDWGFMSQGDMTCFGIVRLDNGLDQLMQTVQTLDKNGEIILKK